LIYHFRCRKIKKKLGVCDQEAEIFPFFGKGIGD
jgi:hypothetical protein